MFEEFAPKEMHEIRKSQLNFFFRKLNCYVYEIAPVDPFFCSKSLKTASLHNEAS